MEKVLKPSADERLLRAFLDVIILRMLSSKHMTGYEINNAIFKKFKIPLGPNIIYTKLSSLERKGLITCEGNKVRCYKLTNSGNDAVNNLYYIRTDLKRSLIKIF